MTVEPITIIRDNDIVLGRKGFALKHRGNQAYRTLVNLNKELYATCQKCEKIRITKSIVAAMRANGGRFIHRVDGKTSMTPDEVDADGNPVVYFGKCPQSCVTFLHAALTPPCVLARII